MSSSSLPDAGAMDVGPSAPSEIFVYENSDPIEFWVHPSYPSRNTLVSMIKAHGGVVTDDFESAHFAVVSKSMTDKQLEAVKQPESNTIAISGTWIDESVNSGGQIPRDGHIIWMPAKDTGDFPVTSFDNPSPSTRTQDERFFLWACEKLLNENPLIQWVGIYRWCASETRCRPESYWSSLNASGSAVRSKAQRIYRSVVGTTIGLDASKPVADTPPSQSSTSVPTKHPRHHMVSYYSGAEHQALIEYLATDPAGSKAQIFERFHQMQPQRSATAWKAHSNAFGGFFWEQATRMKAGMSYQLFPPYHGPRKRAKSGVIEQANKDDQTKDGISSAHDSDSSYNALEGDEDEPDAAHRSVAHSSRPVKYVRYTSEERRDMVAHLVKYPGTNWTNYTSKHAYRTYASLLAYHHRHPSLDREAAELTGRQKSSEESRGGHDVSFTSEAGPSNSRPSRPPKRLQPLDSSLSKSTLPNRPRPSDPGVSRARHPTPSPNRLSSATSATDFEVSTAQVVPSSLSHGGHLGAPASGAQTQTQPNKFDREDWKLAMEFVASRDPPEDPFENMLSWKTFAKKHTTLDLEGWLELYYSDLSLFKSMEAHRV